MGDFKVQLYTLFQQNEITKGYVWTTLYNGCRECDRVGGGRGGGGMDWIFIRVCHGQCVSYVTCGGCLSLHNLGSIELLDQPKVE